MVALGQPLEHLVEIQVEALGLPRADAAQLGAAGGHPQEAVLVVEDGHRETGDARLVGRVGHFDGGPGAELGVLDGPHGGLALAEGDGVDLESVQGHVLDGNRRVPDVGEPEAGEAEGSGLGDHPGRGGGHHGRGWDRLGKQA